MSRRDRRRYAVALGALPLLVLVLALGGGLAYADTGDKASDVASSTIVNAGDRSWTFTIISGEQRSEHTLAPGAVVKGVCVGGCIVVLDGVEDGTYVLEGDERVAIEDGFIYYDDDVRQGERLLPREQ